jgi:hypothetical protein
MKKLLSAAIVALSVAGTAVADPIYIDVGVDFGGNANTAAGATTTGWIDQLTFNYQSESLINDLDGSGTLSLGDTISSTGGIFNTGFGGLSDLGNNLITSLSPGSIGGGPSDNDFGSWGLTFGFNDLVGMWTGTGFVYTSGTISMFYYEDTIAAMTDLIPLFDLNITSGGDAGANTALTGFLNNFGATDINGVSTGNVFNSTLGSFGDYIGLGNSVYFTADQNTDPLTGLVFVGGVAEVSGEHDGSLAFSVPEPASIAILGLGLLGLAGARRRKN